MSVIVTNNEHLRQKNVIQTTEGRKNLDNIHYMYSRFFVALLL